MFWAWNTPPFREMLDILKRTYCSTLGVEFMHISNPAAKSWLQGTHRGTGQAGGLHLRRQEGDPATSLLKPKAFEKFLDVKYTGHQTVRP